MSNLSYESYFAEIFAAASKHRFFDPSSGHLAVAEAARLRVRLDEIQAALENLSHSLEQTVKLERLALAISQSYLGWLKSLALTTSARATSVKRIPAAALDEIDSSKAEAEIDDEQRRIEAEIFGD